MTLVRIFWFYLLGILPIGILSTTACLIALHRQKKKDRARLAASLH